MALVTPLIDPNLLIGAWKEGDHRDRDANHALAENLQTWLTGKTVGELFFGGPVSVCVDFSGCSGV